MSIKQPETLPKRETLPKGIRRKGDQYQWNRQINGIRVYGTASTLKQAIKDRANARPDKQPASSKPAAAQKAGQAITYKQAVAQILANYEAVSAANTYRNAVGTYRQWGQYLGENRPLDDITVQDIDAGVRAMREKGHKPSTINTRLVYLSKLFTTAKEYGWTDKDMPIHWLHYQRNRIRWFTPEEEQTILDYMKSPYKEIIKTLIDTGLRRTELINLKTENIDLRNRKIILWQTKNKQPRTIPMTNAVYEIMEKQLQGKHNGQSVFGVSVHQLTYRWEEMKNALGYKDDPDFVLHACRHTCATRLIKKGVKLALIQKWLGHTDIATTLRYAHLDDDDLFEAVKVLN